MFGLLISAASLVVELGCRVGASAVKLLRLQSTGSVVVAHDPSCSSACGILPYPLHEQLDSLSLSHGGSAPLPFKKKGQIGVFFTLHSTSKLKQSYKEATRTLTTHELDLLQSIV